MTTPDQQSANHPSISAEAKEVGDDTGQATPREDVNDNLPLPNDPVDATGLLTADDLNGEAPD